MPTILTDKNFQREVLEHPAPVLMEIGAEWSGASHIMAPVLERLALRYRERLKIGLLDADANETVPQRYGVREIPTILLFKRGQVVGRIIGTVSSKTLEAQLETLLRDE